VDYKKDEPLSDVQLATLARNIAIVRVHLYPAYPS